VGYAASGGRGLVLVYAQAPGGGFSQRSSLELDAHEGNVRDLVMVAVGEQLLLVTCGDDGDVCVWDARSGAPEARMRGRGWRCWGCAAGCCCRCRSVPQAAWPLPAPGPGPAAGPAYATCTAR
jgi:hypothetical protein